MKRFQSWGRDSTKRGLSGALVGCSRTPQPSGFGLCQPKDCWKAHLLLLPKRVQACKIHVAVVGAYSGMGFSSASRRGRREVTGLRSQEASFLSSGPPVHLPLLILSGPNTGLAQAGLLKNKPQ